MTVDDYLAAAAEAGSWRVGVYPRSIAASEVSRLRVRVGVYFACLVNGRLHYVGSAVRPRHAMGVAARIREHSAARRARWTRFWILPLRVDAPRVIVHAIEGQIIDLLDPPANRRRHGARLISAA